MFEANNSWRCRQFDMLQAVFPHTEVQRYRLFEISLNVQIFHLDIRVENNDESYWSRYLFDNFRDVLDFVTLEGVAEHKISIQSARCDSNNYSIRTVDQVFEIINHPGAYFYKCDDGMFVPDSMHEFPLSTRDLLLVWSFVGG
jgi:hypothetical protein